MPFYDRKNVSVIPRSKKLEISSYKNGLRKAIFGTDGSKFIGDWKDNKKNGKGLEINFESGTIHKGEFRNNLRDGFGMFARYSNGLARLVYRGAFQNGKGEGPGSKFYENGNCYYGNFSQGKRNGYGQMWYTDGSYYYGEWLDGVRHGEGILVKNDGNRYEGNWKDDEKNGKGRFYFLSTGQIQEGIWKDGIPCVSTITDIPYRQTCLRPTKFAIPKNCLAELDKVLRHREEEVLLGTSDSCFHVEIHKSPRKMSEQVRHAK